MRVMIAVATIVVAGLAAAGCGGRGDAPVTLATYTFDDLKSVVDTSAGLTIDHEFTDSRGAALCVDAPAARVARLIEMTPPAGLDGRLLVWTARVRPLMRIGSAWLETWARVPGHDEYSARSPTPVVRTRQWVDLTVRIRVEKGEAPDRLRLNLVMGGEGKFWIESVKLTSEPLPRKDAEPAGDAKSEKGGKRMTAGGRLYLAGAMSAGRDSARRVALIATAAADAGWRVLTLPVVDPSHDFADTGPDRARRIFQRDMSWLAQCDALIAEISTPSHGVGFEIAEALRQGKPTLCLRDEALSGMLPSAMLMGNPSPLIACHHCADDGIAPLVAEFLSRAARAGAAAAPNDPRSAG